ncbi:MAG: thiamine-phosphate kinase [Betaproteobacteria bacterium]|nr:thiamine-phosphate kinase [Betaproteobacteria bacterium]
MASEFDLIRRHFTRPVSHTVLGVGDDGAIVRPGAGMDLVVSTDMLVAGTHFLADSDPAALGWKALAVNLSDLAAMGAQPRWALLAAALPAADEVWIGAFAGGFFDCAARFGVDVIGGDTTRGPLNLAPTVFGEVPRDEALRRCGAHTGDDIWVSGRPGLAALGLAHLQGRATLAPPARDACLSALHRPQPRVALGLALRGVASAAIDVSDGLLADLGHILEASELGADVHHADLPWPGDEAFGADPELVGECLLAGGDDYELLFTAAPSQREAVAAIGVKLGLPLTRIGAVRSTRAGELRLLDASGRALPFARRGFDHFA